MKSLLLDFSRTITSSDELTAFNNKFQTESSKYDSVVLHMGKDYSLNLGFVVYDAITFLDYTCEDKTIILDYDLCTPDLSFIMHFLTHTTNSEIKVEFDSKLINAIITYAIFKKNVALISDCISHNEFNSKINIVHTINDEFIEKYSKGELNDYLNFIKDIDNIRLSVVKESELSDEYEEKLKNFVEDVTEFDYANTVVYNNDN